MKTPAFVVAVLSWVVVVITTILLNMNPGTTPVGGGNMTQEGLLQFFRVLAMVVLLVSVVGDKINKTFEVP
jgi:hypothetical protein